MKVELSCCVISVVVSSVCCRFLLGSDVHAQGGPDFRCSLCVFASRGVRR